MELPPRFQADIWQRIAAREAVRRHSVWRQFARLFFVELATPRYAIATILVAALAGIGAAHLQAGNTNSRHWKSLEVRYVESIDPYEHISAN